MRRMHSSNAFMIALSVLVLISALASYHFFAEMNSKYVLVSDGLHPHRYVLDNYKFVQNRKALIFSLTFLIASLSFGIMVLLPSDESAPQPMKKSATRKRERVKPMAEEAGQDDEESSISAPLEPQAADGSLQGPPAPKIAETQVEAAVDVEEDEVLLEDSSVDDVTEGEDDVVYGNGQISNAAVVDFVHKYPDSALKFLYHKQLDGKTLTNEEERIYSDWEKRGMSRGKVKKYILTLMEWERLPKEPLYEIWKKIRDHIFENF